VTHPLIRNAQPVSPGDMATKKYVDAAASGLDTRPPVRTYADLPRDAVEGTSVYVEDEQTIYVWHGPPEPSVVDALAAIEDGRGYDELIGKWMKFINAESEC